MKLSKNLEKEIIEEIEEYSIDETDMYIKSFTPAMKEQIAETNASSGLSEGHISGFMSGYLACVARNKLVIK